MLGFLTPGWKQNSRVIIIGQFKADDITERTEFILY